jgi:hypothetical protein
VVEGIAMKHILGLYTLTVLFVLANRWPADLVPYKNGPHPCKGCNESLFGTLKGALWESLHGESMVLSPDIRKASRAAVYSNICVVDSKYKAASKGNLCLTTSRSCQSVKRNLSATCVSLYIIHSWLMVLLSTRWSGWSIPDHYSKFQMHFCLGT